MAVKVSTIGLKGLEGYRVEVEVHVATATESMVIVGLPDTSVKESKERVLAVLQQQECDVTDQKIVVNLSPPEQKKNGPLFDLAMVVGVLKERGHIKDPLPQHTAFLGTLSLTGDIQSADGMLPAVLAARVLKFQTVYLPFDEAIPLHLLENVDCIVVQHIEDVIQHLNGQPVLPMVMPKLPGNHGTDEVNWPRDFKHVIGHEQAKRALKIAAAGEHNVLMSGPPGCGKSMLAETFPSILPTIEAATQLEVISLYQLAGEKITHPQLPPFRHPHHSASSVALIGGGSYPKPGEISLAHGGVLFLDEMAEFTKKTLDMLRQPLETGKVTISRAHSTVTFPASFLLIGAMNPCPCGYLGSTSHYCTCTQKQIIAYRQRISGPVYDRIDILLSLTSVCLDQPQMKVESSSSIRQRTERARKRQYGHYGMEVTNAKVPYDQLMETSPLTAQQQRMLTRMSIKQQWSNRVQIKIIRLARTISDLAGVEQITDESIWEAMTLRRMNEKQPSVAVREQSDG